MIMIIINFTKIMISYLFIYMHSIIVFLPTFKQLIIFLEYFTI